MKRHGLKGSSGAGLTSRMVDVSLASGAPFAAVVDLSIALSLDAREGRPKHVPPEMTHGTGEYSGCWARAVPVSVAGSSQRWMCAPDHTHG